MQNCQVSSPKHSSCEVSWLIRICLGNILGEQDFVKAGLSGAPRSTPLPVRLECLQLLAVMAKNHFSMIRYVFDLVEEWFYSRIKMLPALFGFIGNVECRHSSERHSSDRNTIKLQDRYGWVCFCLRVNHCTFFVQVCVIRLHTAHLLLHPGKRRLSAASCCQAS